MNANNPKRIPLRRAFTLIELIITIALLMLMVYFGASITLPKARQKQIPFTPETLKEAVRASAAFNGRGTLLCTGEACDTCYFRTSLHAGFSPLDQEIKLGKEVEAFAVDLHGETVPNAYGTYRDKPVCLLIHFYDNGASTPVIIKNDNGVYFLPSMFGKPQRFDSVSDAAEAWLSAKTKALREEIY